jgi:hypothetical protein
MRVLIEERETFTAGNQQAIVNYTASVINRLTLHGVNAATHRSQLAEFSAEEIATQCTFGAFLLSSFYNLLCTSFRSQSLRLFMSWQLQEKTKL